MAGELKTIPPARSETASIDANETGLPAPEMALNGATDGAIRPMSAQWITDELVAYTRRVWSAHLGRPISEAEAVEMLINVRNVAMAILAAQEHQGAPKP